MNEESFEKKSSKKVLPIVLLVILLLAIAGVITFFVVNKVKSKPENVFDKAVEEMFKDTEKMQEYKSANMEFDISAEVKTIGDNMNSEITSQMEMINTILKTVKIHTEMKIDTEKEVFDWTIVPQYNRKDVASIEAIIQNAKMYFYLDGLYEKYIELPTAYLEGFDLSTIFETSTANQELAKDIKEILKSKIENSEFENETTEIEIDGKETKVNKATLSLSVKEVLDVFYDIVEKTGEYQEDREAKEMIEEALKDIDETETKNHLDINIYTEKTGNKIVKIDILMVNEESDELIAFVATKQNDKKWEIVISLNENSTSVKDAVDMARIEITEENENEGTISATMIVEEEGFEATLNVDYKIEYNVDVEKKNIKDTINLDEMTEADLTTIYENAQKNETLNSILETLQEYIPEVY